MGVAKNTVPVTLTTRFTLTVGTSRAASWKLGLVTMLAAVQSNADSDMLEDYFPAPCGSALCFIC